QATPIWGISAYAGYRLGLGSYAIYKGELQTLSGGELRAGVNVPLWRDGPIDRRRAKIGETEIKVRAAYAQRSADLLAVERDATKAYWSWVAAGAALRVARELLSIAEARAASLAEQVAAGSLPALMIIDNRRLVLDRGAKAIEAERKFRAATLSLSLFFRDAELQPLRPSEARLPPAFPAVDLTSLGTVKSAVMQALERRPDVHVLEAAREAAALRIRLTANQRAPAVDLQAFVSKDLGIGPAELSPTELGVALSVEFALPLRQARGEHRAARARGGRVDAKRRSLRDRIEAEVRDAFVAVEAAQQRVSLAREQLDVARTLADAERDLLLEGASDLLAVNLRELAAADAAISEIKALADYHRAQADLVATVGGVAPSEVR
ncbi:MAG TPA: TolC family protein, partial [Nannocystis exedens]|nr:TolC family protein [Nannocystis exedens]